MPTLDIVQKFAVWVLPVLFAITVHEVAHGWVAKRLGDSTAFMLGRLTLNPIKHIDPVGTVLVPATLVVLSSLYEGQGFIIGWARPVPINPRNLHQPRRDMALVAVAGPMANLLMGIGWALVARLGLAIGETMPWVADPLLLAGVAGITINMMLMILNLLPLPPLDGGRVLSSLLPPRLAVLLDRVEPFGLLILILLLATQLLGAILLPPLSLALGGLADVSGLGDQGLWLLLNALLGAG